MVKQIAAVVIPVFLALAVSNPGDVEAMGSRHRSAEAAWQSYVFRDGGFRPGTGASGGIRVRNGFFPLPEGKTEGGTPLPGDHGAAALFCYVQSSGGKLASGAATVPAGGCRVDITGNGLDQAAESGPDGFAIAALPPGQYQVKAMGRSTPIVIESGKTSLAAIRAGKRMVD